MVVSGGLSTKLKIFPLNQVFPFSYNSFLDSLARLPGDRVIDRHFFAVSEFLRGIDTAEGLIRKVAMKRDTADINLPIENAGGKPDKALVGFYREKLDF